MSRGFIAALIGIAVTLLAWFGPWLWPAWPALAVLRLTVGNTFARYSFAARAAMVVGLIAVNVSCWGAVAYGALRAVRQDVGNPPES